MATSRAVRLSWFGGPEALQIDPVAIPQPQAGEVPVRVMAASVNPVDYKIRDGKFQPIGEDKLPIILGRDLVGTIETVGQGAHALAIGDAVFAHIVVASTTDGPAGSDQASPRDVADCTELDQAHGRRNLMRLTSCPRVEPGCKATSSRHAGILGGKQ